MQECTKAVEHGAGATGKLTLSFATNKIKKLVGNAPALCRCHAVGAVGYAVVKPDDSVPPTDFFEPGRKFRIRFRSVCKISIHLHQQVPFNNCRYQL